MPVEDWEKRRGAFCVPDSKAVAIFEYVDCRGGDNECYGSGFSAADLDSGAAELVEPLDCFVPPTVTEVMAVVAKDKIAGEHKFDFVCCLDKDKDTVRSEYSERREESIRQMPRKLTRIKSYLTLKVMMVPPCARSWCWIDRKVY